MKLTYFFVLMLFLIGCNGPYQSFDCFEYKHGGLIFQVRSKVSMFSIYEGYFCGLPNGNCTYGSIDIKALNKNFKTSNKCNVVPK